MDDRLELRHLRYLIAVAEEQNFGRAALKLGIQQPPLSQQIRKLELLVGYRLFDRTSRGAVLTSAGQVLLQTAQSLMARLSEGVEAGRLAAEGRSGVLTIGFAASLMSTQLPSLIRAYRLQYPQVTLRLREMATSAQVKALFHDEIDLGFVREKVKAPLLILEQLFQEKMVALLPIEHRLAQSQRIAVPQLAEEPFVLFPREEGPEFYDRIANTCLSAGFFPQVVQEAMEWYTIVRLVGAGVGVTIAPASAVPMCDDNVAARPLTPLARTSVFLARKNGPITALAGAFIHSMAVSPGRSVRSNGQK